jgi:hypothetical protein
MCIFQIQPAGATTSRRFNLDKTLDTYSGLGCTGAVTKVGALQVVNPVDPLLA